MAKPILAMARGAAISFTLSISATLSISEAYANYFLPGETMGLSLDSPVPEGVFLADVETYGRADKQPDANIGVNTPVILWSTPWTIGATRLEFLASFPLRSLRYPDRSGWNRQQCEFCQRLRLGPWPDHRS